MTIHFSYVPMFTGLDPFLCLNLTIKKDHWFCTEKKLKMKATISDCCHIAEIKDKRTRGT